MRQLHLAKMLVNKSIKNKFKMGLVIGEWIIYPSELREKGVVGRIMWDIAFCDPARCKDKKAYLELLESTAKEIIERVREGEK